MEEVRRKHRNAHNHLCNWQCWDRLPVVRVEDGILEFVEEFSLRFGLLKSNTQIRLQADNLAAELAIFSNMGKEHFQIGCQESDVRFVCPTEQPHEV